MELATDTVELLEWEDVDNCPLCGGYGEDGTGRTVEFVHQIEHGDYVDELKTNIALYQCQECDTYYQNPRMTESSMETYYKSDVYRLGHAANPDHEETRARRTLDMYDYLFKLQPKRFLDVGCSHGYLVKEASERYGCEAIGYDIHAYKDAVVDTVQYKEDIQGKFDLITCIHVLEHYHNPLDELEWMIDMLNNNGMLLIEIPTVVIISIPHPIIYMPNSIHAMMKRFGSNTNYCYMEVKNRDVGYIFIKKNKDKLLHIYDAIYRKNPDKWNDVKRDEFVLKHLQDYISHPVKVLDYGCGNGHTLQLLSSIWKTGEYTGVDISEVALKLCRWNMPDGKFYNTLPDGEWNIIIIMGVAEHFPDPSESLYHLGRRLSSDGYMYLEVPNCLAYSDHKVEGFRTTNKVGAEQDEWHLTRESWENIIRDAGLKIVQRLHGTHAAWEYVWILQRDERE